MKYLFLASILIFIIRASCWSPTDSYAPGEISCPSDKRLVRVANNISEEEYQWVKSRNAITDEYIIEFLKNADMEDFDPEDFIRNQVNKSITIGIAFSGGGYRAMLCGAGQLAALDNRTTGAAEYGLGGLLQASTYLVGLSGGNWLVGTIALNNFTSVQKILEEGEIWDLEHSIVNFGGINVVKTYDFYKGISDDLEDKKNAGFEISLTDTWGRALSHQFFSTTPSNGAALTWSTLQVASPFTNHEMPFPIVVADGRTPNTYIISGNSTIFEVNPYEIGSWDPSLYQFSQVKYLGTKVKNGYPVNGSCIGGFDNAGFIIGTSSSLFNQFILQINTTSLAETLKDLITHFLSDVSGRDDDIAVYKPNPFYGTDIGQVSSIAKNNSLYLVDGGEDLQNVPLNPLLQPERKVDVIFAYDNSADTDGNWPNGTSLIATFERQFLNQGNGTLFPYVPDASTFRNLNLTARPTFFGCDAQNLTSLLEVNNITAKGNVYDTPLIVYTANRPFTYWSNTSTFKLSYEEYEKRGMIKNGFEVASRLNQSLDKEWMACVGCAIIRREQERHGINQTEQCEKCFSKYCWSGELDSRDPGINFTTTGTTNGNEDNGNRTVSAAASLILGGNKNELIKLMGYALLSTIVFAISF